MSSQNKNAEASTTAVSRTWARDLGSNWTCHRRAGEYVGAFQICTLRSKGLKWVPSCPESSGSRSAHVLAETTAQSNPDKTLRTKPWHLAFLPWPFFLLHLLQFAAPSINDGTLSQHTRHSSTSLSLMPVCMKLQVAATSLAFSWTFSSAAFFFFSSSSCSCFFRASSASFLCKIECCSNTIAFRLWASCSYMGPRADSPCTHRKPQRFCGVEATRTHTARITSIALSQHLLNEHSFFRTSASFFRRSSAKASSSCLRNQRWDRAWSGPWFPKDRSTYIYIYNCNKGKDRHRMEKGLEQRATFWLRYDMPQRGIPVLALPTSAHNPSAMALALAFLSLPL